MFYFHLLTLLAVGCRSEQNVAQCRQEYGNAELGRLNCLNLYPPPNYPRYF